ncbi:monofunctional biosynthetic peptidoglycan transglycosylase [Thermobifida fusca]|uniref:monofunctional biosynthetic peptidoglycan transglycosylase n=1 Tax=Thermobifida fusca TaxID=2021 RepID=UPI002279C4DE|nr:monofunctional biosynthetic peptidoglycan transglycosylase [Thermobifida fusca]
MKRRKSPAYWIFVRIPFWFVAGSLLLVAVLKWVPVFYTPLMLRRALEPDKTEKYAFRRHWRPLEQVSPELVKAVIASEDNRFAEHRGFDWEEIRRMWKAHRDKGGRLRGCSTISQQTAKNVFTFGSSTWARKALEVWWTFLIERIWGKERIMEVYLNVIEAGPGIYGAEAAAQAWFGVDARSLSRAQASAIAVCLPNPRQWKPTGTGPYITRRKAQVAALIPKLAYPEWVGK